MRIYGRERWEPRGDNGSPDGAKREGFLHWSVTDGSKLDSFAKQCRHMRQLENIHLDNGWSGIGYSRAVFQPVGKVVRARTFEARGDDRIPAAQFKHNTGTVAVCVVMRPGDKLKLRTRWELVRNFRDLKRKKGITRLRGHRDVYATACPGDTLYGLLPWLRKRTGLAS